MTNVRAFVMVNRDAHQTCQVWLHNTRGAIRNEHNQGDHQQDHPNCAREAGCKDLASVFVVQFRSSHKLGLVRRFDTLLFVPPGAATVEVISNVR